METQLVRFDKPYNIIYNPEGKFGLHIATLLVVNERTIKDAETGEVVRTYAEAQSYPVVGGGYGIDGDVWMTSELKDCVVICREGEPAGLYTLQKLMKYSSNSHHFIDYLLIVPGSLSMALYTYGSQFTLPTDDNNQTINDYEVQLEFSMENDGKSCMVYADKDSEFYFYDYFDNEPPFTQGVHTNSDSIKFLAELRDSYVRAFYYEGLRSILFTTKDEQYQWFVDKLNSAKSDATGV